MSPPISHPRASRNGNAWWPVKSMRTRIRRSSTNAQKPRKLFVAYNLIDYEDTATRREIMEQLFASVGEDVFIEPNFRCEVGRNITI